MNANEAKKAALAVRSKVIDRIHAEIVKAIDEAAREGHLEIEWDGAKSFHISIQSAISERLHKDGFKVSDYGHGTKRISWDD